MSKHALLAAALLLGACATTEQAGDVQASGFLVDYSRLRPGGEGEALLVYRSPSARMDAYDKVLLEPLTIWKGRGDANTEAPPEELERLANLLQQKLVERLREDYTIVQQPGPGVLRIRAALTDAEPSSTSMDIVSMVIPVGLLISGGKRLATGTHAFVGGASAEIELTDGRSGELLMAAVDRRVGGKSFGGSTSSWHDVESAFDYWADRLIVRLREERGAADLGTP